MDDLARTCRLAPKARGELQVVLDELLSNIVRHGGGGPDAEPISVALSIDGPMFKMTVRDYGQPFDPSVAPDKPDGDHRALGGRGLNLVHCMVDELHYCRTGDGRNVVDVTKRLDGLKEGSDVAVQGLTIEEVRSDGTVCVVLSGWIDSGNAAELTQHLTALAASGHRNVVIDFAAVEYLTSAGFRALLVASDAAEGAGGDLRLRNLSPDVRELFSLSGLLDAFLVDAPLV